MVTTVGTSFITPAPSREQLKLREQRCRRDAARAKQDGDFETCFVLLEEADELANQLRSLRQIGTR
jgi:hypothetical protein